MPDNSISIETPVKKLNGHWVVYIPLNAGGDRLVKVTRGLSDVEGEQLKIVIPGWLAENLAIETGSIVAIDNRDGRFNIRRKGI